MMRTLTTKREALVRYLMGVTLALRSIAADPDRFRAFAIPYLELDPSIADHAFASNGKIYFADPLPTKDLFQRNLAFVNVNRTTQGEAPLPEDLSFASLFDTSLAAEAMKRLA